MKYVIFIFSLVALLLLSACSTQPVVNEPKSVLPAASQGEAPAEAGTVEYILFITGDEFSPNVMTANQGDTLRITVANGQEVDGKEKPYDFLIPGLGVSEYVSTGDMFEFEASNKGEFEFYCSTCSPEISGMLIVE